MDKMSLNDIRRSFLDFFASKEHYVGKSYSLVPENDKSLLLINSGMAPLKPFFMGIDTPPKKRMATCQKCIRTGDIENVGKTARHGTFFEMLGNFSFGDYFKIESIQWGWEYVTEHLKMPVEKLWVSVYEQDDDAYEIWNKKIGVPSEKIVRLGKADNFWEIGLGPCGPCSEIYFDRGEKYGCGHADCKPGCDCDRYVEFWNHVFTQFDRDEQGNYNPLPKPNIDTGMGLERVACIMQGVDSIFEIDTMQQILEGVTTLSKQKYGANPKMDISIRIITDHIRSVTFMVSDGIMPSNEGRGYVLRRLLRRAAKHGKQLGIQDTFLTTLVDRVIGVSGQAYPELVEKQEYIKKVIAVEEDRFRETIDQGSEILKSFVEELRKTQSICLSGENAFKLYDTYGFPLELTKEILEEEGFEIDETGFKEEMEKQRVRARSARQNTEDEGWKEDIFSKLGADIRSAFEGYGNTQTEGNILTIMKNGEVVETATQNDELILILDRTPFYPEGGGQIGDKGFMENETVKVQITDCKKGNNERILHYGKVLEGTLSVNTQIKAIVEEKHRKSTARNHTATHLLHKALKEIVGQHVEQAGSYVTPDRLRFDFSHFQALTTEELDRIEALINEKILMGLDVKAQNMSLEEAKRLGATALFGEKYGNTVRVVSINGYSIELCGGTHIENIGQIGLFKIVSEGGVAAGIRRIEAVTGLKAYEYIKEKEAKLNELSKLLKTNEKELVHKTEALIQELKGIQKEIETLKLKLASSSIDEILEKAYKINELKIVAHKLEGLDMDSLRNLADKVRDRIGSGVVVLGTVEQEKVNFVAMATDEAVKQGVHAGNIIKEVAKIAGGGGGGRPNMAQAGAKDPAKLEEALAKVEELVKSQLK
ncbi:alanine--tRNA ligase [Geosporobacter ferrireducens]|uniref:Alanine--tRNA ligase n=1 Tax=Geosporobacter ferrireducens TaxID=1424294 RepID=A0A1D8GPN2_9FIRM|nr:alanine--tRNA ligase [Geosporobacter ferrireducens]AOT72857.1 alanine--tRNA ligase [Geosporobacter ferrireducens]MTI55259.1 alanine--tRNA ligase [Geosporobacter ferrireducens]